MPKLGESVTEGTITSWLVKEGDFVNKYDPIAEVMTDKVNAEVPSSYGGIIKELIVQEGETVAVDEPICHIEIEAEDTKKDKPTRTKSLEKAPDKSKTNHKTSPSSKRARYSPAVVRLASEHDINLSSVEGTGLGGRITRKDVLAFIENEEVSTKVEGSKDFTTQPEEAKTELFQQDQTIPVTGVRKVIADNMVRAKQEIPHAWMTIEVDVTDLVALREKKKDEFKKREGIPLTYFSFFVYAVTQALKEYPELNSTWQGDHIIQRGDIHMSIAVAKENELFVPVIKHADEKNIRGLAKAIATLAQKTYEGNLTQDEMSGGTFTINNTGTFGSISSMGIINYPQAAILQVESIVKRPVIIDDMFAARDMVNLCLSLDHRILDGLICGRFLARVKEILESINEDTFVL